MAKQERQMLNCSLCGAEFTKVVKERVFVFRALDDNDGQWQCCPRCYARGDAEQRQRAARAASERWAQTVAANDRMVAKCKAGTVKFVDKRSMLGRCLGTRVQCLADCPSHPGAGCLLPKGHDGAHKNGTCIWDWEEPATSKDGDHEQ